ncbi:MAG: sugar transferase [Sarcina sp.]
MEKLEVRNDNLEPNLTNSYSFLKRGFDVVISSIGVIICSPIVLVTCVLVVLESKGSPIYSQKRVGLDNKEFNMYKIRSMRMDAEKNGAQWAQANDPRVTRVGKFIRMTRIDEMPQLWNVLKNDMSIIGPRPERKIFYQEFEKKVPEFRNRLLVKPGITGYAQVNGGYELSAKEKLELDLYYIKNVSAKLEVNIVFKTFRVLFTGEGAR